MSQLVPDFTTYGRDGTDAAIAAAVAAIASLGDFDAAAATQFADLPIGAGGFVTGLSFSADGVTRVMRADSAAHRWDASKDRWVNYVTAKNLPAADVNPDLFTYKPSGVVAVAVSPSDNRLVFMAYMDSLYRSEDGSRTWVKVLNGSVPGNANDEFRQYGHRLVIDPSNPSSVYYGSPLNGLWYSRDRGQTWTNVAAGALPFGTVVDVSNNATRGFITRGTVGNNASAGVSAVVVDTTGPQANGRYANLYAAVYGQGIYRSTDSGLSWAKISTASLTNVFHMRLQADGSLIATGNATPTDPYTAPKVWRYSGGGAGTWTDVTPSGHRYFAIAVDPLTAGRVVTIADGGRIAVSTNYGTAWTISTDKDLSSEGDVPWIARSLGYGTNVTPDVSDYFSVADIRFDPVVPGRLWLAEGLSVWFTELPTVPTTGRTLWRTQGRGIEQLVGTDVVVPPGGKPVLTNWDRAIFYDASLSAFPESAGPSQGFASGWNVDWSASDPTYLVANVASHQSPNTLATSYSNTGGKTWVKFPTMPTGATTANQWGYGTLAVGAPGNVVWVPSDGKRPHFTKDNGATWTPITLPGFTDDASYSGVSPYGYYIRRNNVAADRVNVGTFYLYVPLGSTKGLYRSTDGGTTWAKMTGGLTPDANGDYHSYEYNTSLKAVPGKAGHLFITHGYLEGTTANKFRRSTDGGATFSDVAGVTGVSAFGFGKAFPDSTYPTIFLAGYVGGKYGIWRSIDNAATWTRVVSYPNGRLQRVQAIDGDKDVAGRFFLNQDGSGWVYGQLMNALVTALRKLDPEKNLGDVDNPAQARINLGITDSAGSSNVQVFSVNGNWVKPAAAKAVRAIMIGAGGDGGSGRRGAAATSRFGGGGGGAGGYTVIDLDPSTLSSVEPVVVGQGGTGAAPVTVNDTNGAAGTNGGASQFGNPVRAQAAGGAGGFGGASFGVAAAAGGSAAMFPGGSGGQAITTATAVTPTAPGVAAPGGPAGGSIDASDVIRAPGAGTGNQIATAAAGVARNPWTPGGSGPGGAASVTAAAGAGTDGQVGAGGAGGGASLNGFASGAGGKGGTGVVVVITTL